MSKFKVGDRVRVVSEEDDFSCRPFESVGKAGKVEAIREYGVIINVDGYGRGWAYEESELELIND